MTKLISNQFARPTCQLAASQLLLAPHVPPTRPTCQSAANWLPLAPLWCRTCHRLTANQLTAFFFPDVEKVKVIRDQEALTTVKSIRGFLSFVNFYRTFIKNYLDLVRLLTDLIHKDKRFEWLVNTDVAFRKLKEIFVLVSVLVQFDYDRETRIETDSSGWYIGGTL